LKDKKLYSKLRNNLSQSLR